jgi:hypothetical protein
MREYEVFVGIFGAAPRGEFTFAHVTVAGGQRNEYVETIRGDTTAPRAWEEATFRALQRVNRPDARVTICIRDRGLALRERSSSTADQIATILRDRPHAAVTWLPSADRHAEMDRAHELARGAA